ncbi:MAG: hypothetical protein HZC43_01585 [Nitrosomonadales bacterium]|nr:hypothetical protein [Nitrosomonadales bacterium]
MEPPPRKSGIWDRLTAVSRVILIVFFAAILPSILAVAYVYSLTPAERWLFMMKRDAQPYADALLSGDTATQDRYGSGFKDHVIVANRKTGTVLFSPRGDTGKFSLLYAPNESSAWLTYEQSGAKRIKEKWYELAQ